MKVTYKAHMGTDLSVVNAARVSFAKESHWVGGAHPSVDPITDLADGDKKLISFLARHNHWTPFGHTAITLHIKAPIFVARQLGKHQVGMVWNEVSRRYVDDTPEIYLPDEWRMAAENVKQGSSDEVIPENATWRFEYLAVCRDAVEQYNYMVREGIAPEQARMILPQSMYTEWYWTGNLYSFVNVYRLRTHSTAQREVQDIANQIQSIIEPLFPVSWQALTQQSKDD